MDLNLAFGLFVQVVVGFLIYLVIKGHLFSYFQEKGKNLATKEDIEEITDKVERVRSQYTAGIEVLRSELVRQTHMHRLSFEKEFEILSELWAAVVDLRAATLAIRPILDFIPREKTEEQVKEERLERFNKSYAECYQVVAKNRPFYPEDIYQTASKIMEISIDEVRQANLFGYKLEYWNKAEQNAGAIITGAESICQAIRKSIGLDQAVDDQKSGAT